MKDLTPAESKAFYYLKLYLSSKKTKHVTSMEIAEAIGKSQCHARKLLNKLIEKGCVVRFNYRFYRMK